MNPQELEAAISAYPDGHAHAAPNEDGFDLPALNEAYEAYFDCTTGGSFGGIRAAIKVYTEMVRAASRADDAHDLQAAE